MRLYRDWPEPYLLSKLIRCLAMPIKKCWLATSQTVSEFSRSVRSYICVSSHVGGTEFDVESESRNEHAATLEANLSRYPVEKAKVDFRKSLQKTFSSPYWVDRIMADVEMGELGL